MSDFNKYLKYKKKYLDLVNELNGAGKKGNGESKSAESKRSDARRSRGPVTPRENLLKIQKWYWSKPHVIRDYSVHILAGRDYQNIFDRVSKEKRFIKIKGNDTYKVAKYIDDCTKWGLETMVSRGLIFNTEEKTFSFPLVKFFSFDQLSIVPSGEYRRYKKYDGSAIYLWDNMITTLGSPNSPQVGMVTELLKKGVEGDDLGFPKGWTIFGEFVDGTNDQKVERISGPAKFYVTYGYNHKGQGFFPEEIREQGVITNPNVVYAEGEVLSSEQINKELEDMDKVALASGNIADVKEGMVLWQDGIPYKLKSRLYMGISNIQRPKSFLKPSKKKMLTKEIALKNLHDTIDAKLSRHELKENIKIMLTKEFNEELSLMKIEAERKAKAFIEMITATLKELKELISLDPESISNLNDLKKYSGTKLASGETLGRKIGTYIRDLGKIPLEKISYENFLF